MFKKRKIERKELKKIIIKTKENKTKNKTENNKKSKLYNQIILLNETLEKSNLTELLYLIGDKKELFKRNLYAGIARGIGVGIGVTFITAILIYLLQKLVLLNIPIIGKYIADIIQIIQNTR